MLVRIDRATGHVITSEQSAPEWSHCRPRRLPYLDKHSYNDYDPSGILGGDPTNETCITRPLTVAFVTGLTQLCVSGCYTRDQRQRGSSVAMKPGN